LLEQESGYRPDVIRGETLSRAGAAGIAQFMPATAEQYGVDPLDTDSAIDGAARYLAYLVKYFDGDLRLAIYAYNGGEGNVSRLGPGFNEENAGYYDGVIKKSIKYGNSVAALNDPATMRPTFTTK
jgi:soluble lytic murein transglycosylase-like protein